MIYKVEINGKCVRPVKKKDQCFESTCKSLPENATDRFHASMFDSPEVRNLIKYNKLVDCMTKVELNCTWKGFVDLAKNILANH